MSRETNQLVQIISDKFRQNIKDYLHQFQESYRLVGRRQQLTKPVLLDILANWNIVVSHDQLEQIFQEFEPTIISNLIDSNRINKLVSRQILIELYNSRLVLGIAEPI